MRQFLTLLTVLCLAFTVTPILAGPIADSLAFQGRLTDASDVPVPDGPRDLTISLWTDSVGGTMLHSEVVIVTVSKGLYSTCIGCASSSFFDIFTDQSVYLQVQLAGSPPMTPRTVMRSVPFAVSSSSLSGKKQLPGGQVVSAAVSSVSALGGGGGGAAAASYARLGADSDGDGHDDFVISDSARTDGVHSVTGGDLDGDGSPELASDLEVRVDRIEMKLYDDSDALQRSSVSQGASTDSANQMLATDLDGDGIPDVVVASSVRPSHASLAIKTKGTSAQRLSGGTDCDDTDATNYLDYDDDGDGIHESSVSTTCNAQGASTSINAINGGMPNRISMNVTMARVSQTGTVSLGEDSDGDGLSDNEISQIVTPTTSAVAIQTKGTGADKNRTISGTCDDSSAVHVAEIDDDGDGIAEGKGIISVKSANGPTTTASSRMTVDRDDNGTDDNEASMIVTPTTSSVAIKTKGTGADKNRTAGSSADDSTAVDYLDIDDDGDGISEAHAYSSVSSRIGGAAAASYAATGRMYTDSDDDGIPEGEIESIVTPGTSSVAIKTKGTGADKDRVISSTTDTSKAVTVHSADVDGDGLADRVIREQCDDDDASITVARGTGEIKIKHKGWDGTIKGRMAIETGGAIEVDFGGDGVGFVSQRFGIGVLSPTNPLEHSSGAHLTAGGVWTNASDENLKENFQPVDGAELLEKIEQLPISEWNYKTESDEIKHIGPTAQDFQATFGVGSDGKSISTIDPSGIALAAIKQLKKENSELKKQIEELSGLKNEIEQLKKLLMEKK